MQIRLRITTSGGTSRLFEHTGPRVRIGRDPASELSLEKEDGKAVSWNHARIDLAAGGATLTDLGSSNGTLLNERRIEGSMALHENDCVQLGHTGALLRVLEIDLSPDKRPPGPRLRPWGTIVAAGVGIAVLLTAGILFLGTRGSRQASLERAGVASAPSTPTAVPSPSPAPPPAPRESPREQPQPQAQPGYEPVKDFVREVGRFVSLPEWGPAILLQRQDEAFPWLPLRPEGKVNTAVTLVSLPGYRSTLALDSGVKLTLWGNLPEFSAFPPILESAVMLNVPPDGIALDVTLDRGRIHLANTRTAGAARIQLRFLRQVWQLTLPEPGAEICAELWTPPASSTNLSPIACLGLFTKGKVQLCVGRETFELADRSRVTWLNAPDMAPRSEVLAELPQWWLKPPDHVQPLVADALLALKDWADYLSRSNEVIDTLLTRVRETNDSTLRVVGLLFLSALDGAPFLLGMLEDRAHPEVRGTVRHAVQTWLARRPANATELQRLLREEHGYAADKAALVCKLLQPLSAADLARAQTYQELIGYLDHDNLPVRDLAFWHLANLVPDGPRTIAYDPAADSEHRRQAVELWHKLVPPGAVPRPRQG